MARFITLLAMILVGAVVVLFAVSNRALVELTIWPLPFAVEAPVYAVAFAGLAVGILWGGVVVWCSAGRARRRARSEARRAADLERNLETLKEKTAALEDQRRKAPSA